MQISELKINQISYEQLKNLGNFQNEKISVSVILSEGQDPKEATDAIREWVALQLNVRSSIQELNQQKRYLEGEIKRLNSELNVIQFRMKKIADYVSAQDLKKELLKLVEQK